MTPPTHDLASTLAKLAAAEEKPGLHIRRNGLPFKPVNARINLKSDPIKISALGYGRVSASLLAPPTVELTLDDETIIMDPMTVMTTSDGIMHMESVAGDRYEISQWRFSS